MAFIETHQSLRDHRKILALASELEMPEPHVAGHCVYLWLWSLDNAPDGILPKSERIIERAAGWLGAAGAFVAGMVSVGMLDRTGDGTLLIHDWYDYAGRLIEKRRENAERMRAARAKPTPTPSDARAEHVQRTLRARAGATLPYTTVQNTEHDSGTQRESPLHWPDAASASPAIVGEHVLPDVAQIEPLPTPSSTNGHIQLVPQAVDVTSGETPPPPPVAPPPSAPAGALIRKPRTPPAEPKVRPRDPIWDALVDILKYEPKTPGERSKWGKAVHDLKLGDATPDGMYTARDHHAALYAAGVVSYRLSIMAFVNNYGDLLAANVDALIQARASPSRASPRLAVAGGGAQTAVAHVRRAADHRPAGWR